MSKADDIAAGVSLIGALKGLGGGNTAQPNPAPRPDADPDDGDDGDGGPDSFTRADIDALIGCLDSIADSLEVVANTIKAASAPPPPVPLTQHQRKPR